jgi:hypothetical protein
MIGSPSHPLQIIDRQAARPSNDKEPVEFNVAVSKAPRKFFGPLQIVQGVEPVHELAEPVIEWSAPLLCAPCFSSSKNAAQAAFFKLDHAESLALPVSDYDVRAKVSNDLKFVAYYVCERRECVNTQ